jgi:hypothetical protein
MMGTGGDSGGDDSMDGRKGGKRELSNSKRAAQNRAAQVRDRDVLRFRCSRDGIERRRKVEMELVKKFPAGLSALSILMSSISPNAENLGLRNP